MSNPLSRTAPGSDQLARIAARRPGLLVLISFAAGSVVTTVAAILTRCPTGV